ncbi:DUF2187 domain-containing protein [Lactiplantibacillus mudanjiangensis]|uniref:DUF2187 domain-containing protein n=1 Tax=Lactiplantibacillus mudanjiangensis TaxID=1296538 RepID=A0A660DVU7_9LACO|nr:DUF2187 domain-containing protein [Lactiplantibacillus mudanjiangensis]VDG20389.1 hypothetical protein MUDAN_BIHEEGNE_02005 [Lactiplantibacillus mudanjiangensis]VDG23915.1 hypothetical protein MUDAN_IGPPGNFN_00536 [Lactiplantibacillus mudanjiangensis]VDG27088.1 hypothetical protein MUDAN_MDHGFNIF_02073 [Lactiplantibacillus mudanjiangensis]
MAKIAVGDRVKCQKNGNTDYDFYAKVEKVYENSAYVTITHYDVRDDINVAELQYRAVIALKKMKLVTESELNRTDLQKVSAAMLAE